MAPGKFKLRGNIIDPFNRKMGYGSITVQDQTISGISFTGPVETGQPFLMPGFIDAHVHIDAHAAGAVPASAAHLALQ